MCYIASCVFNSDFHWHQGQFTVTWCNIIIFKKEKKRNGNKTKMAFILQGYAKRFLKSKLFKIEKVTKIKYLLQNCELASIYPNQKFD